MAGVLAAVVGIAALAGSGAIHLDSRPSTPAHGGRMAIVDAAGGLSTIAADGTDRRVYPMPGVAFQFPAWSPDGREVATIGFDATQGGVFVVDDRASPTGGTAPVVAFRSRDESPIYLYWSPVGRRITFLTSEPEGLALQVVAADAAGPASVIRRGQPLYWDWVDGTHVLVHSGGDSPGAFLGEVGLDPSSEAPINASAGPFQAPAVSPGGRYRSYVARGAAGSTVVIEARDGSSRHETPIIGPGALGWNPAGNQLAFTAPDGSLGLPVGPLQVVDAGSGAVRKILDGLVVAFFWAPDGKTIAALRVVLPGDQTVAVTTAAVTTAAVTTAARPIAQSNGPSIHLFFVDVASGSVRSERQVQLSDILISQFLPYFDQYARSHRLWSPASDAVVLPLVDAAGDAHVTILPADGSPSREVADGVAAFWSP
jgi:TolB protein